MCEPISIATSALQTFSMFATAGGALLGAKGAADSAATQRTVARNNAIQSELAARDAEKRGEDEAQAVLRRGAALKSSQRVALAANGLDLEYGTAADLQDQTDFFARTDAATVRENAGKEMAARRQQGANYQGEANSYSPFMAGASSLLTGAGKVADKWYSYTSKADSAPARLPSGWVS